MKMKEFHDNCSKPCLKLDADRKTNCLNTCDQQTKVYSSRFNNNQEG
jgi:hypothetical protein